MVACPKLPPTCLHFPPEIIFSFYGLSIPVMNSSHGPAAWRRVTQLTTLTGFHWIRLTWKNHPNLGHIKCACLVLSPYQHPSHVIWKILAVEIQSKPKCWWWKSTDHPWFMAFINSGWNELGSKPWRDVTPFISDEIHRPHSHVTSSRIHQSG